MDITNASLRQIKSSGTNMNRSKDSELLSSDSFMEARESYGKESVYVQRLLLIFKL